MGNADYMMKWMRLMMEFHDATEARIRNRCLARMRQVLREWRNPGPSFELFHTKKLGLTLVWKASSKTLPLPVVHAVDRILALNEKGKTVVVKDRYAPGKVHGTVIPETIVERDPRVMTRDEAVEIVQEHEAGMMSMSNPLSRASLEEARELLREGGFLKL